MKVNDSLFGIDSALAWREVLKFGSNAEKIVAVKMTGL